MRRLRGAGRMKCRRLSVDSVCRIVVQGETREILVEVVVGRLAIAGLEGSSFISERVNFC